MTLLAVGRGYNGGLRNGGTRCLVIGEGCFNLFGTVGQGHVYLYHVLIFRRRHINTCGGDLLKGHAGDLEGTLDHHMMHQRHGDGGFIPRSNNDILFHRQPLVIRNHAAHRVLADLCGKRHIAAAVRGLYNLRIFAQVKVDRRTGNSITVFIDDTNLGRSDQSAFLDSNGFLKDSLVAVVICDRQRNGIGTRLPIGVDSLAQCAAGAIAEVDEPGGDSRVVPGAGGVKQILYTYLLGGFAG